MSRKYWPLIATIAVVGHVFHATTGPLAAADVTLAVRLVLNDVYKPLKVRSAPGGALYVLSRSDNSIARCRKDGERYTIVGRIGGIGNGPGELLNPADFAVAPDGTVWVADAGNNRVVGLDASGRQIAAFGVPSPLAVAVVNDTIATVATYDRSLVTLWSREGQELAKLGAVPADATGDDLAHKAYASRGYLAGGPRGTLFYVFRSLLPPRVHVYDVANKALKHEIAVTGQDVDALTAALRSTPQRQTGGFQYSTILNGAAVSPSGDVWVALAGPMVYRFAATGQFRGKYAFHTDGGTRLGVHDVTFVGHQEIIGISAGIGLWAATIPADR
jgi:hypothetical protein